jgi:hypothetical protein
MLKDNEFWTLTVVCALALVLAFLNMFLFQSNRALQAEANGRAQYIQQSIALEQLYRQIVQELADRAVRTRDDQIRDMLAAEGLNLTFGTAPAEAGRKESAQ